MVNILIVEQDANYCIKLLNDISKRDSNIRTSCIANNLDDMYKHITTYPFDVILLDFNLLISKEMNEATKDFIRNNKKSIIILSETLQKSLNFFFVLKNDIDSLINKILEISANKIDNIILKNKINAELQYLGYNPTHIGTSYISEIIYIIYHTNYDDSLEGHIYPYMAEKYNKTVNTIKCNIINATNLMVCECEENKLLRYLGKCDFFKPGPKTIIYAIINKISQYEALETAN